MLGRLPRTEQLDAFRSALGRNETLTEVLARTAALDLPGWYVTAGCLFQTVWNVVTGRPPAHGIRDYDVFYFDDTDLSWAAEDAVIRAGREAFDGLRAEVEIRNEARVHLWYERKFGVSCPPYDSTESAIDRFAATTCWKRDHMLEGGMAGTHGAAVADRGHHVTENVTDRTTS